MEKQREKILIAEDDKRLAELIIKKLEKEQYSVYLAENGQDALEQICTILPDLVILDVVMPGLDGFGVKEALTRNELTRNIPVIFLTGRNDLDDKIKGLGLGADDYITKPFRKEELLARVEAILRRKRYYEYLALHDALTGLYNRTYFRQQFTLFFDMAERYQNIFSLVIIDVNKFKAINDTYGHQIGDLVLKQTAILMQNSLRKSDILSRFGGDEFAVLLPHTPGPRAEELAARLAETVAVTALPIDDNRTLSISLSYGIAGYEPVFGTADEMFELADKQMYACKKKLSQAQ